MSSLMWGRRAAALPSHDADDRIGSSRRSFLGRSGRAAAIAVVPGAAVAVTAADAEAAQKAPAPAKALKDSTKPPPDEPLMAYIQNAKRGEVVIMRGETQRTVRDRELVRRLVSKPKKRKVPRRRKRPSKLPREKRN